jgi:hypothetical protein
MDTAGTALQRIKRLLPKHEEIMNRLILGQKQKDIAGEMGMTQSRLSIIINSPLFQLELKKKMMRREEKMIDIEDNLLDGAKLGTKFHKDILEGQYPTDVKMRSATVMSTLGAKMLNSRNGGSSTIDESGEGKSYEERLREVTFKESIKVVTQKDPINDILNESYPPDDETDLEDERNLLFGPIEEESEFDPSPKIETILEGCESKNDSV